MAEHTVYHPTFRDVIRTGLDDMQREGHKKAGWRMTPIPSDTDAEPGNEPADPRPSRKKDVIKTD